jgi:hypothetical protein
MDDVSGTPLQFPLLPINLDDIHLDRALGLERSAQEFCEMQMTNGVLICIHLYRPGASSYLYLQNRWCYFKMTMGLRASQEKFCSSGMFKYQLFALTEHTLSIQDTKGLL